MLCYVMLYYYIPYCRSPVDSKEAIIPTQDLLPLPGGQAYRLCVSNEDKRVSCLFLEDYKQRAELILSFVSNDILKFRVGSCRENLIDSCVFTDWARFTVPPSKDFIVLFCYKI